MITTISKNPSTDLQRIILKHALFLWNGQVCLALLSVQFSSVGKLCIDLFVDIGFFCSLFLCQTTVDSNHTADVMCQYLCLSHTKLCLGQCNEFMLSTAEKKAFFKISSTVSVVVSNTLNTLIL